MRYSNDLGVTFSAPVMVNAQPEPIYDRSENRPKLAIGTHGELYVSWSQSLARPWTGFVWFARSLDGGAHFSTPITVHVDRTEIGHAFDALAVDGKGRVVVAWIDKRDAEAASARKKPYLGAALYYSWSDDQGRTFAPERKLMDHSCDCCRIALARTPRGDIAAFFRGIFGDNIRDHAYAVLHADAQPNKVERATFDDWQIAACPRHGPGLAIASDGTRHVVWYVAKDTPTIWYGQLDPGHRPRHVQAIAGTGASHADVAVDGHTVWVAWNQVNAQGYTLMIRQSFDDGAHFDKPRSLASTAPSAGAPQLLLWRHRAYVAWNTAEGFRLLTVGEH
ncbi:MAG TPA: sialidase family protein [Dyella sp.]|uniref:sialidase family protein n=1 Tax=Dyella sp. TaxID=1869338 RepID=UPI002C529536|nr:sialidase family protein [Dyella sp.]HUB90531.1 sialidase family protein [Dyella sp.]